MARTELTVTEITRTSVDATAALEAANADGEMFINNGNTFLEVSNTNAATCTVTIVAPREVDGLAVADLTFTVAQNVRKVCGPFPKDTFNNVSTDAGKVYVNYSAVTDVTVRAWRL